jgi:hypothetical protein
MVIADSLKLQRIQLVNFAASGAIGTAAATVDIASSIAVAQTAAGVSLTLPNPTDTTDMRVLYVQNTGTASVTVGGTIIPAGKYMEFTYTGTAWVATADTSPNKFYVQQALVAGNNTITHNLNLAVPKAAQIMVRHATTGETILGRVTPASMTSNALVFNVVTPVTLVDIIILG